MVDKVDIHSIPNRVTNLIDRVCEPAPQDSGYSPHPIGVTEEIAQEAQDLTDIEIGALVNVHSLYHRRPDLYQKGWAAGQLISHVGPRAIPFVVRAFETADADHVKRWLISILGDMGENALGVLDDIFSNLTDAYLAIEVVDAFFSIGESAAHLIALALEYPDSKIPAHVMKRITTERHYRGDVTVSLVNAIATSVIDELIARDPSRPYRFNDKVAALCLQTAIDRNPQLRGQVCTKLRDLVFQDDLEVRERAVQVAANLDLDYFLQLVRVKAPENLDASADIMYRLGRSEPLPTQKQSLEKYTGQLQKLEEKSLARWDAMAWQSKFNFWLRNLITILYFVASLAIIGLGIWFFLTADDTATRGIAGVVSALTTVGGMLIRFWKAPVEDIKTSFVQQAGVEATFIGFMTRSGQIRLLFEQGYAKGEIGIEELGIYLKMIADAQTQTAQELELIKGTKPQSEMLEASRANK